jgi:drug/metabolite transporter (DMT)-like permease
MLSGVGVFFGLMAGCLAALSYLFSRQFQSLQDRSARQLLALSSAWMALFATLMLPWVYRLPEGGWISTLMILLGVVGGYGSGMFLLFGLLRQTSSSSITPIMGLKILILTIFALCRGEQFSVFQYLAIVMVLGASALLKDAREGLSWKQVLWAFAACCCYAVSDSFIRVLITQIDARGGLRAAFTGFVYTYIVAGSFALLGFSHLKKARWSDWRAASGYASCWFGGMCFFYCAMASVGIVYTIILQATRSLWAVLFGVILVQWGYHALERDIRSSMRWRQFLAGLLTLGAIGLYSKG